MPIILINTKTAPAKLAIAFSTFHRIAARYFLNVNSACGAWVCSVYYLKAIEHFSVAGVN